MTAFSDALKEFGKQIEMDKLNTKGNAWVAAFPTPNTSINTSTLSDLDEVASGQFYEVGQVGADDSYAVTESQEEDVDRVPHKYDFLGPGIDGGFRISKNSTVESLTVSAGLAYLLCKATDAKAVTKFDGNLRFRESQIFKGVCSGEPYPVVTLETSRDDRRESLAKLQADALGVRYDTETGSLQKFLEHFLEVYNIPVPVLRSSEQDDSPTPPREYTDYIKIYHATVQDTNKRLEGERQSFEQAAPTDPALNDAGDRFLETKMKSFKIDVAG